nr:DUF3458 domain-containing protein [Pyrinomonadaceae bacterium]
NIYLNRHKLENVETPDLQRAMEEGSGQKLDWFFAQWIYGGGNPRLEVEQNYDAKKKILTLKLKQTQEGDALVKDVFILPLEVEIQTPSKTYTEKIKMDKREQTFSIKVNSSPQIILIDKNSKIPLLVVKMK